MTPTAVGLDLSLTGSGIASSLGWCEKVGQGDITTKPLDQRIALVGDLAEQVLVLVGRPTIVCVEVPAFSRAGGGVLERSALWWLIVRSLHVRRITVVEIFNQQRMRYATGKGAANKGAIVDAVARRWPQFETGGDDNLADAAVLAAMGADWLGHPLAPMPATHRLALDKVRWPEGLSATDGVAGGSGEGQGTPKAPDRPTSADTYATTGGI